MAASLTWPADAFPTTWDPGPSSPVQGRCCGSLTPYWKFPFAPRCQSSARRWKEDSLLSLPGCGVGTADRMG